MSLDEYNDPTFDSDCREFTDLLLGLDLKQLTDEQYLLLERATRLVVAAIDTHIDAVERASLADVQDKLIDAVEGFDSGLPLDPSKRPSDEQLMEQFSEEIERLGIVPR